METLFNHITYVLSAIYQSIDYENENGYDLFAGQMEALECYQYNTYPIEVIQYILDEKLYQLTASDVQLGINTYGNIQNFANSIWNDLTQIGCDSASLENYKIEYENSLATEDDPTEEKPIEENHKQSKKSWFQKNWIWLIVGYVGYKFIK